jgi:hypothetical protein
MSAAAVSAAHVTEPATGNGDFDTLEFVVLGAQGQIMDARKKSWTRGKNQLFKFEF